VLLKQQKEGDTINLLINRDGQLRELKITTAINDKVSYSLEKIDKPTDKQKILYKAWLRTNN